MAETSEWSKLQNDCFNVLIGEERLTHMRSAIKILAMVLERIYGPQWTLLLFETQSVRVGENEKFAVAFEDIACKQFGWIVTTRCRILAIIKKMLSRFTKVDKNFISTTKRPHTKKYHNYIMPRKYGTLSVLDETRLRIESWIQTFREQTTCRSDLSLRNVVLFLLKVCRRLNWDVDKWSNIKFEFQEDVLRDVCDGNNFKQRLFWLKIFFKHVLQLEFDDKTIDQQLTLKYKRKAIEANEIKDDHDYFRIDSQDLDKLYSISTTTGDILDEIFFLILITTGMRLSAVTKIELMNVATIVDGDYVIKDTGKTIEKGRKLFTFAIVHRLKELLYKWVRERRAARTNIFLFPGQGQRSLKPCLVRKSFKKLCSLAGFEKCAALRPHAMRHSFAHILFEQNNTAETISKLMNHSSVETTKKYYLKEDAVDVLQRTNIPWFKDQAQKKQQLPEFFKRVVCKDPIEDTKTAVKKQKLSDLSMFAIL